MKDSHLTNAPKYNVYIYEYSTVLVRYVFQSYSQNINVT